MTNKTTVVLILILAVLVIAFKLISFKQTKKIMSDGTVIIKPKKLNDERSK